MKAASAVDLKKQQFQPTKERPELNPVLSALINEDVKKSIDAKRHAELEYEPKSLAQSQPTTALPVLTTAKYVPKANDDSVVVDSIAGSSSEKKQVHFGRFLRVPHPQTRTPFRPREQEKQPHTQADKRNSSH